MQDAANNNVTPSGILKPEGIKETPVVELYKQNLKTSMIFQRSLEGNPLVKNPYELPRNSGIPSDMVVIPCPIPLEKTKMESAMHVQLADLLQNGYSQLRYEHVTNNEADMVDGRKFYIPNARQVGDHAAINDSYLLITYRSRIEEGRQKHQDVADAMFDKAKTDMGNTKELAAASGVKSLQHEVDSGEEDYKDYSNLKVDDLLSVPRDGAGKRNPDAVL